MSIFGVQNQVKRGNQRISERYLRKMGFKKSMQWGNPHHWGPGTVYWEKFVTQYDENGHQLEHEADIIYFPSTFTGYVTDFGEGASNKILCMIEGTTYSGDDYHGSALCKNDIQFVLDYANHKLNKYNHLKIK
jgi:hypothetical protein